MTASGSQRGRRATAGPNVSTAKMSERERTEHERRLQSLPCAERDDRERHDGGERACGWCRPARSRAPASDRDRARSQARARATNARDRGAIRTGRRPSANAAAGAVYASTTVTFAAASHAHVAPTRPRPPRSSRAIRVRGAAPRRRTSAPSSVSLPANQARVLRRDRRSHQRVRRRRRPSSATPSGAPRSPCTPASTTTPAASTIANPAGRGVLDPRGRHDRPSAIIGAPENAPIAARSIVGNCDHGCDRPRRRTPTDSTTIDAVGVSDAQPVVAIGGQDRDREHHSCEPGRERSSIAPASDQHRVAVMVVAHVDARPMRPRRRGRGTPRTRDQSP